METINRLQTKNYIVNAIKKEILSGNIKAGEELVQESIAGMLGVSRMPVREAFQLLEQDGFIIRLPNRHMQVAKITANQIVSIFKTLIMLETQMLIELCEAQCQFGELMILANEYLSLPVTSKKHFEQEIKFHKEISKILGNVYLEKIHHSMLDGYFAYARQLCQEQDQTIIEAMKHFLQNFMKDSCGNHEAQLKLYFMQVAERLIRNMEGQANE